MRITETTLRRPVAVTVLAVAIFFYRAFQPETTGRGLPS